MFTLYYDTSCPICSGFVKMLRKKIPASRIKYEASSPDDTEFKLKTRLGNIYYGNEAIDALIKEFPEVKSYASILPDSLRVPAIKTMVSIGSTIRRKIMPKKKCNCG